MKQKLLFFFLTAFLSLTGGGQLWANEYVLSSAGALCIKNGTLRNVDYSQVSRQFGSNGPIITYSSTKTSDFTVNNEVIKFNGNITSIKDPAGKITITKTKSNISSVEITFQSTGTDIHYTCNGAAGTIASGSTSKAFTVNNSSCDLQFDIPNKTGDTYHFLQITKITIHTASDDGEKTPIPVDASFANSTITCEPSSGEVTNALTVNSPSLLFEPTISYALSGDAIGSIDPSTGTVTLNDMTGTATVTATITPPNTDYYAVTNKTYTLTSAINSFAGTYPYTWDFTTGWGVTAEQLSNSSYWGDYDSTNGIVVNQTNIYDEFLWTGNSGNHPNLGKTYGIKFTSTKDDGVAKRIKLCPGSYVQIQNGVSFKFSSLSKGQKITVETSESNGFNSVTNATLVDGNYVVSANGDVIFDVSNQSNSGVMKITRITISKPTLEIFRLEGSPELTRTYDASKLKIGRTFKDNDKSFMIYLDPNVATALETKRISSDLLHVTVDDESVVTVSDVKFADNDSRQRGTFFLYAVKPGTTNINLVFDGNDTYEAKTVSFEFTLNKASQSINYPSSSVSISHGGTIDNTLTVENNPSENTITYASSDTHVATVDSYGTVIVQNAGTCTITATLPGNDYYNEATANYTLTVTGSKTPTLKWTATNNGDTYTVADLPYGNSQSYTAAINNTDDSDVTASDIRYGVVEAYEGYLTVGATDGKIQPTRKFADEKLEYKEVQVYAYTPSSGDRNASPRILYNVKIVKGKFSGDLFKQNYLTVNAGCTIAPQNNVQSMRWDDIDEITVVNTTGRTDIAVSGPGTDMVSDYKADIDNKTLYFDTKTKDDVEIVDWFYPVFHGKAVGKVTFTVTLKSKLYGDQSGEFTLHVIPTDQHTVLAWAEGTKTKYTIYEGDYMLLPEVTGSTNGNFSYSSGYDNQNSYHKYVYSRRWNSGTEKYETIYNNKNFHKGEGFPNFDLTSDAEGNTPVPEVQADGSDVALLFWNTGQGTENDRLLIYGNQAGTVYLKASDPQVDRSLSTIEIEVKSRSAIDTDFENLKNSMTFPYTWDFTSEKFMGPDEVGNGYWVREDDGTYSLDMQSNINYDYADENKDGVTWSNKTTSTTSPAALTSKLLVSSYSDNSVMRGFAGMKIKLGNSGTGSWYSKRDGIHILPYINSNTPRLRVTTGTHTLILPTPTGENCPETFKVFVKAKALEAGDGTLWVRKANIDRNATGQNSYYNFKNAAKGEDIIYSVDATKDTPLELDLDKVDIYWIAYSTEARTLMRPQNTTYAAATYSYGQDLDLIKSNEVNGVTAYYASGFTLDNNVSAGSTTGEETQYAVKMKPLTSLNNGTATYVKANQGILLKKSADVGNADCYMIANPRNVDSYSAPETITGDVVNYLVGTGANSADIAGRGNDGDGDYTNFLMGYAYKYYTDITNPDSGSEYRFDRDWSFYPLIVSGTYNLAAQRSYLHIPRNVYVNKNGEIVDMPTSARAAFDVESAADDTAEAPATKAALSIVFDDSVPATPEDPATEEPEDGDSDKDKDRPRKPGDDGWPKPPFPPFPPIITDIDSVNTETTDNAVWHSMEGVRISQPTKPGLYIRNGKKVVIK